MSDDLASRDWITAKEAARLLKVSDRQVNHYGNNNRIRTQRAGRRVLYYREDVENLARTLQVDIRPAHITRQDANDEIIKYVQQQDQRGRELLEAQRAMFEQLGRIEQRLNQPSPKPSGPSWQLVATLVIVLAIALVVLGILVRMF